MGSCEEKGKNLCIMRCGPRQAAGCQAIADQQIPRSPVCRTNAVQQCLRTLENVVALEIVVVLASGSQTNPDKLKKTAEGLDSSGLSIRRTSAHCSWTMRP